MSLSSPNGSSKQMPFKVRLFACLSIFVLVVTQFVLPSKATAFRNVRANAYAPVSTPPEPFVVGRSVSVVPAVVGFVSSSVASLGSVFQAPKVPEGLSVPPPPSLTERAINGLDSLLLAFVAPSTRSNSKSEPMPQPMPTPSGAVPFDFDYDGKADIGRWQGSTTEFKVKHSNGGSYSTASIGSSTSKAAPGDFDGDHKTDAAVFTAGTWTIKKSSNGSIVTVSWGTTGDIPVAGDYDGDGMADTAVFRPSTNVWWVLKSSDGNYTETTFGSSGDIVVPGNYDGDSKSDLAVFRPSTGDWHITGSASGYFYLHWGLLTDVPAPADFDGDGKTDPTIFRPSSGTWYAAKSSTSYSNYFQQTWGNFGDQPVPADYDGDAKADFSVWRPTTGVWYTKNSKHVDVPSYPEFSYDTLGVAGDVAVPSAYIKQVGASLSGSTLAKLRIAPANATGNTDLYSQNFSWGTSLAGLPGRAGLNAGIGVGYSSLVWIKDPTTSSMIFDPDKANLTPGFRFGFPVIEPAYYGKDPDGWNYIMVTPSGGRIEFKQTAVSGTYETADSSYTQLVTTGATNPNDPVEDISITVINTDGTQMSYEWKAGAFRCKEIKDRNGNFITIENDAQGLLRKVTDTLGREINVAYNDDLLPTTIMQTWKDTNGSGSNTPHTYATLSYTTATVDTSWNSTFVTSVYGPPDDSVGKVLDRITYADSSYTKFLYNGYLQVKQIENYAADSHKLNHVETSLGAVSGTQQDCPRFIWTKSYAENVNSGTAVEVTNSAPATSSFTGPNGAETTKLVTVAVTGHPDSLYTKIHYAPSGWKEGFNIATEDCIGTNCTGTERKRWTWSEWDQDNVSVDYLTNPRVIQSRVGDGTNTKKSEVEYWETSGVSIYGLVKATRVYGTDLSTVLKESYSEYNLGTDYTDRRVIGLPSHVQAWGMNDATNSLEMISDITYSYDEGDFDQEPNQNIEDVIQHDSENYDFRLVLGRGNLTSVTRHDPTEALADSVSSVRYDIAGSPVAKIDALDRKVTIDYSDVFNDTTTTRNTFAYPTTLTDPNEQSSTVKYRYDIGANVEATSPAPAGNSYGKMTRRTYDDFGRLTRDAVWKNVSSQWVEHAYTRREFPTNGIHSKTYSTVIDTGTNGPDSADEVLSESWSDGAGRVYKSRTPHTFDTNGTATWAATKINFDILGRAIAQLVPTEVDNSWARAGDDASRDWLWKQQEYDWKGRVTRTVNTDGTDTLAEYEGCGCAGGEIVTVRGEEVTQGRRIQKMYADILGRNIKTEMFDWNEGVYSTVTNAYNGRDQVTSSRIYPGNATGNDYKETTNSFDGFGRLSSSHNPQQTANKSTSFTYFADHKPSIVADARGAMKHFVYNNIGLVDEISWTVPTNSGIEVPATVTFDYDNLGNRTAMQDGFGTVSYAYNSLSQLTSETRNFNETVPLAPLSNNGFQTQYAYDLSGQLKTLTEPFGEVISYGQDKAGRLTSVSGNRVSESVQLDYITEAKYRAWGAVKSLQSSNNMYSANNRIEYNYNDKLQAENYTLKQNSTVLDYQAYQYHDDGKLSFSSPSTNSRFDRSYEYDFLGRLTAGKTGAEARGGTESNPNNRPYRTTLEYNQFGDITSQQRLHWSATFGTTFDYQNSRMASEVQSTNIPGWFVSSKTEAHSFDDDGRRLDENQYDAEGRIIHSTLPGKEGDPSGHGDFHIEWEEMALRHSGDGTKIRMIKDGLKTTGSGQYAVGEMIHRTRFYIRSSVLGEDILEIEQDRLSTNTYTNYSSPNRIMSVFANGAAIAKRGVLASFNTDLTILRSTDPSGVDSSVIMLRKDSMYAVQFGDNVTTDTFGAYVGTDNTLYPAPPPGGYPDPNDPNCEWNDYDDYSCDMPDDGPQSESEESQAGSVPEDTCYVDGFEQNCRVAEDLIQSGDGYQCPQLGCSIAVRYGGKSVLATYTVTDDGFAGYIPSNATYSGNGFLQRQASTGPPSFSKPNKLRDTDLGHLNNLNHEDANLERDLGNARNYMPWLVPNRSLLTSEVVNLRSDVATLLGRGKCAEYIADLLRIASTIISPSTATKGNFIPDRLVNGDILGLFDQVNGMGGFRASPMSGLNSIRGTIVNGDATVYLVDGRRSLPPVGEPLSDVRGKVITGEESILRSMQGAAVERAVTAIHELLHFNFSDNSLATAVAVKNKTKPTYNGMGEASKDWGNDLRNYCK